MLKCLCRFVTAAVLLACSMHLAHCSDAVAIDNPVGTFRLWLHAASLVTGMAGMAAAIWACIE